ncbi:MAG: CoA transferase subunit A [Candidatus Tectomicrobia bacterium]|uniref:CoA transferase subunit A n=1 Tax=Tectimicrobiota bacterium TaxID=2528274 RepID=A0A932GQV9_UNCTE|nr:CoA transferase subunit A [Candidatus Tectomicrobia bacterium]
MANKLKSAADVVRSIPDGSSIALGGFAVARNVITVVHELIRQHKKNLTLSQCVMGMDTDLLVGAGLVSRLIVGGGSLDRFGLVNCVNRARESGQVESHDYSSLSICFRYLAGALGISFIPIKSLIASEVLERLESGPAATDVQRMKCPFTGEEYLLLKALTPDVALVHVQVADREGNCRIDGPRWENEEQAKAARRVIIIAEEIVPTEYIQRYPERTVIPAHRVEAVIHQPFGAHPTAVFGCYDYDGAHLELYVDHVKRPDRVNKYLDEYVLSTRDHWEYLEKVGGLQRLNGLRASRILGY